jgi:hypothetical protein
MSVPAWLSPTHLSKVTNLAEADHGGQEDKDDYPCHGCDGRPEGEQNTDSCNLGGNLDFVSQDVSVGHASYVALTDSELP